MKQTSANGKRAFLFATCLVDLFYPSVGEAMVKVLEQVGVTLDFPEGQTCCGLPLFNNGYVKEAAAIARKMIPLFQGEDPVVVPSGSCGWMLKEVYPTLFSNDEGLHAQAKDFSERVHEFSEFLVRKLQIDRVEGRYQGRITYHPSCHLLRGLRIEEEPIRLLKNLPGAEFVRMEREPEGRCCGFGGSFSVKFPELSNVIMKEKLQALERTGAEILVVNDAGCMLQLQGGLSRLGRSIRVMHLAEVLAEGMR